VQTEHKKQDKANLKIIADHHAQLRASTKIITNLQTEADTTAKERLAAVNEENMRMKQAVQAAREEERKHYSEILSQQKKVISARDLVIESLTKRVKEAEKLYEKTRVDANKSARRSKDLETSLEHTQKLLRVATANENNAQVAIDVLQETIDRTSTELEEAFPIKSMKKTRDGSRGQSSWPLWIWEDIMQQLVLGVPPKAVYRSMANVIKRYSPKVGIQPISLTTILRARTVLLVVVQTLAAYRLGKADKFGQLFQDATSRQQISFQNLAISIEEDELYK